MPTSAASPATLSAAAVATPAPFSARASWVMFDWAVQPFYTLIVTFLFGPYFTSAVATNSAEGQAYWGYAAAAAGVLIALGSPFLGALADGGGRRKPWIALFSAILAGAMMCLWFAVPGADTSTIFFVLAAFVIAMAAAEFTAVFTNSMMPGLVPAAQFGSLSGTGWAVGYFGGLAALVFMAGFVVPASGSPLTFIGFEPLLPLDQAAREGDRLVGPFSALWYLVFIIPLFLFVPDRPGAKRQIGERSALGELWDTIRALPQHTDMLYFLIARMLYADGISAIFLFGGIYGTAVFGWGATEQGLFGIVLLVVGAFGALAGGFLDDKLGAKTVILSALAILIVGALGILSVDQSHILYFLEVTPKAAGSAPFSSLGEQVFLAFGMIIAATSAPAQAASRSLLARLAPPEKITQYFGLFAFSGKATAFLAPFLVASVTIWALSQGFGADSQRLGMATITLFLLAGIVLMLRVAPGRRV